MSLNSACNGEGAVTNGTRLVATIGEWHVIRVYGCLF